MAGVMLTWYASAEECCLSSVSNCSLPSKYRIGYLLLLKLKLRAAMTLFLAGEALEPHNTKEQWYQRCTRTLRRSMGQAQVSSTDGIKHCLMIFMLLNHRVNSAGGTSGGGDCRALRVKALSPARPMAFLPL